MSQYDTLVSACVEQLGKGGAFLMTGTDIPNPMTIGWCQWGQVWGKPVFTLFVRPSRYSHKLLENGRFTVSFPVGVDMKKALGYCGTKSGRDGDKLAALGLGTLPPRTEGGVPALAGCTVHFECSVLASMQLDATNKAAFPPDCARFYNPAEQATPDGDLHTVYFAEILASYETR